ncbi:hypothetical protein [Streptomyces spirodelae]|uniref:DUF3618 domain-containing protein n=1 Tax=Streptomyces spirodelae TaxID=2812904 RepID=A0ABS3WT92_9ACTN|nr:hypothetical protein [Streptomyces spirodelae]MBO8186342.1 hypothetical protein [Streptomyces spirodelae]
MADPVKNSKGSVTESKAESAKANGAKSGAKAGEAVSAVGGAARKKGEAAKDTVVSVGSKAGTAATVGVTAVKERKKITAGAAGGLVLLLAGAFALGRGSARRSAGPLTRLTDGRL